MNYIRQYSKYVLTNTTKVISNLETIKEKIKFYKKKVTVKTPMIFITILFSIIIIYFGKLLLIENNIYLRLANLIIIIMSVLLFNIFGSILYYNFRPEFRNKDLDNKNNINNNTYIKTEFELNEGIADSLFNKWNNIYFKTTFDNFENFLSLKQNTHKLIWTENTRKTNPKGNSSNIISLLEFLNVIFELPEDKEFANKELKRIICHYFVDSSKVKFDVSNKITKRRNNKKPPKYLLKLRESVLNDI
jgi:hypothetical protein